MFPPRLWRLDNITSYCRDTYALHPTPRPGWVQLRFGGTPSDWSTASNIVFSNGLLDPWHEGGILTNLSDTVVAVVIPDGAHHYDLRGAHANDTAAVRHARREELSQIGRWVDAAKQRLGALPAQHHGGL